MGQYASEGASVPYIPGTLISEELAVHSEFAVDHEEDAKGGYRRVRFRKITISCEGSQESSAFSSSADHFDPDRGKFSA